jgi:hypothetical protein
MYEHFTAVREDMDVYDVNGDKIGKTNKLYQPTIVSSTPSTLAEPVGQPFVRIETGFLGLGKHFYIPATAIADVSGDRVTLNVDKDRFDEMGWDERPDFIDD